MSRLRGSVVLVACLLFLGNVAQAQLCPIAYEIRIVGDPPYPLDPMRFGTSAFRLGDLDGDGTIECLVGAPAAEDPGYYVVSLHAAPHPAPGTQAGKHKVPAPAGVTKNDRFGSAIASLGDVDDDGWIECVIGAPGEDDGAGAVYVISLDPGSNVAVLHKRIGLASGGFSGALQAGDGFGSAVAPIGDLNGDGTVDLVVGAPYCDDGAKDAGAIWVLFLDTQANVIGSQKTSASTVPVGLQLRGAFGSAITSLGPHNDGDLNGDGLPDIAVGAPKDGGGAAWILFLQPDGQVSSQASRIQTPAGGSGSIVAAEQFGSALTALPAPPGEGEVVLLVGAPGATEWAPEQGALWYLGLDANGNVLGEQKVNASSGGFAGFPQSGEHFGASITPVGDLDGNSVPDVVVGAPGYSTSTAQVGSLWSLLQSPAYVSRSVSFQCANNPAELSFTGGSITPGATAWVELDFATGTAPGSTMFYVCDAPTPSAPCGQTVSGYVGELLVDLAFGEVHFGPVWGGPGSPVSFGVEVPDAPDMAGRSIFVQAVLVTVEGPVFSNAVRLVVAE